MNSYSIIIPVYNSEESLYKLCESIELLFKKTPHSFFEIIFIHDNSSNPETIKHLKILSNKYTFLKVINFTKNFGQQAATYCGLQHSKGDYIITMDDDFQHNPEDIFKLLEKKQHDVVLGKFKARSDSKLVMITSKIKAYFDYLIINKPKNITASPYRLIKRNIVNSILKINTSSPSILALIFYVTQDVVNVNVSHHKAIGRNSNYNFNKRLKLFFNLLIFNSSFLLKVIGYIGSVTFILSFILGGYFIFKKTMFGVPLGYTSIIVSILFIGGLNLLGISVLGEYFVRLLNNSEQKPPYVIRDIINEK